MYTYRQILKQAFKIAWQNPSLWVFGFLVGLLGSAGGLELVLSSYGFGGEGIIFSFLKGLTEGGLFTITGLKGAAKVLFTNTFYLFIVIFLFLLVFALSFLIIWLATVSQSALIGQTISNSKNKKLGWQQSFQLGLLKFWPVLGINISLRLASWLLFFVLGFLFWLKFPISLIAFIPGFTLFLILILIISFIGKYAICGVVLKDWKFLESLKSAWQLFIRNWWLSLEIAIILFSIYLITNLILGFFISLILFYTLKIYFNFLFALILVFSFAFITFIVIQIILVIFHWAVWALVFELISSKKAVLLSFLFRIFGKPRPLT